MAKVSEINDQELDKYIRYYQKKISDNNYTPKDKVRLSALIKEKRKRSTVVPNSNLKSKYGTASTSKRIYATLIDALLTFFCFFIMSIINGTEYNTTTFGFTSTTHVIVGFIIAYTYLCVPIVLFGKTLGKHIFGLRVSSIKNPYQKPNILQAFIRELILNFTLPLSFGVIFLNRNRRHLGDLITNTQVIEKGQQAHPEPKKLIGSLIIILVTLHLTLSNLSLSSLVSVLGIISEMNTSEGPDLLSCEDQIKQFEDKHHLSRNGVDQNYIDKLIENYDQFSVSCIHEIYTLRNNTHPLEFFYQHCKKSDKKKEEPCRSSVKRYRSQKHARKQLSKFKIDFTFKADQISNKQCQNELLNSPLYIAATSANPFKEINSFLETSEFCRDDNAHLEVREHARYLEALIKYNRAMHKVDYSHPENTIFDEMSKNDSAKVEPNKMKLEILKKDKGYYFFFAHLKNKKVRHLNCASLSKPTSYDLSLKYYYKNLCQDLVKSKIVNRSDGISCTGLNSSGLEQTSSIYLFRSEDECNTKFLELHKKY